MNRARDPPACSTVSQPTTLMRASMHYAKYDACLFRSCILQILFMGTHLSRGLQLQHGVDITHSNPAANNEA